MATTDPTAGYLTLITIFTVPPAQQTELADLLARAGTDVMRTVAGFISTTIHKSHDGNRVITYTQWQTREHYEDMQAHPAVREHLAAAAALARFEPLLCDVVDSISR